MASESTQQLLKDYHTASMAAQVKWQGELNTEETKKAYGQFASSNRELISRCILSDDPRSLMFLLEEMEIILTVLRHFDAVEHIQLAGQQLVEFYTKYESL